MPDRVYDVVVVDDDAGVLKALGRQVRTMGHMPHLFGNAHDALEALKGTLGDCLLVDLQMPELDGLGLQRALVAAGRNLPILFLSGHGDVPNTVKAMQGGALDFLEKPIEYDVLDAALGRALAIAEERLSESAATEELRARLAELTPRQQDVFEQVISGAPNKSIAFDLGISERTVKAHRQVVMKKLQVRSVAELCFVAARLGIVD